MMDIRKVISSVNPMLLDAVAREALGSGISGISTDALSARIHLLDESSGNQNIANMVLDNYGDLSLSADVITLTEGDADPIVTCADVRLLTDVEVGYIVLLDGEMYAKGTANVLAGEATLNLVSPVAGIFEVFVYRMMGDYASGSVQITVSEV